MALTILSPSVAAAVAAAQDQSAQRAAAISAFASLGVTVRYFAGDTLAETATHGPVAPNSLTPLGFSLGPLLSSVVHVSGATITHCVWRSLEGSDILRLEAEDMSPNPIVTQTGRRTNAADASSATVTVSAKATLPISSTPVRALTLTLADSAVAAVAASGSIINTGNQAQAWSISPPAGVTVTPSSGALEPGASQAIAVTAAAAGSYSLSLVAAGATITGNPQVIEVSAGPATSFTLAVPLGGITGSTVSVIVTPNGPVAGGGTVSLALSGGGTLGSTTLTWAAGEGGAKSTTLTRAADGATTVTMTNSAGLTNLGTPSTFTSVAPGTPFTTLAISNPSGSAQAANWITPMFGHAFRQGDVPAGEFPAFALTDGTPCPSTQWGHTYWPDGSLRFCGAMLRVPTSVAAGGSLTVNVSSSPSGPSPSTLTAASISAASDIKVRGLGFSGWTAGAEWVSALNQGIADGDVSVIGSGEAGLVLRVYEGFRASGADHGQVGMWHYVAALQDAGGALYGLRYMGKFANGWHDVTAPVISTVTATGVELRNGASVIRAIEPTLTPVPITFGSAFAAGASIASWQAATAVRLSSTGTLPAGLSSSTVYYLRPGSGSAFTLHPTANSVGFNSGAITPTDAGTGVHTMTPLFTIGWYAAGPFTCGPTAVWDFVAGVGSGAETPCLVRQSKTYIRSTKLLGPLLPVTPPALATRTYQLDRIVDLTIFEDTTGERPDIGWVTAFCLNDFLNNHASLQTIRVHALQSCLQMWSLRRFATKAPVNLTAAAQTGMGAPMGSLTTTAFRFYPGNIAANAGVNAVADWGRVYGTFAWAHKSHTVGYAYLVTGEPQYLDMTIDQATAAVATSALRGGSVGSFSHAACVLQDPQIRNDAWVLKDVNWAAALTPDNYLGANVGAAMRAILAENFDFLREKKATGNTFTRENKFFPAANATSVGPWQIAYMLSVCNQAYAITQDTDARTASEDIIANYDAQRQAVGLYLVSSYYTKYFPNSLNLTSWNDIIFQGSFTLSWSAATDVFTANFVNSTAGALSEGGSVVVSGFGPPELNPSLRYYARDVGGTALNTTFKLAATPGGAPIDISTSATNLSGDYCGAALSGSSPTSMAGGIFDKSYPTMMIGGTRWAKALGMTVPAGWEAATDAFYGAGPTFNDPIYAMDKTF